MTRRCSTAGMKAAHDGGVVHQARRRDRYTPVGLNRSAVLSENSIRLGIRIVRQNHRMIGVDACSPVLARNVGGRSLPDEGHAGLAGYRDNAAVKVTST